jgi:hypothetical protein
MARKAAAATALAEVESPANQKREIIIAAPKFEVAEFHIVGTAPLVIHRFSAKTKLEMKLKMETGKSASSRKNREAKDTDDLFEESRYVSREGWDGFHAASIRNAMISACRLVNFKMTLAKLSVFVEADGWDAAEPQIPLLRIGDSKGNDAQAEKLESMARVETGQPYVSVRAIYHNWTASPRIRFDADQFKVDDVANLLARVGLQVGIGEGRPDSKNSAGQGWGLFSVEAV